MSGWQRVTRSGGGVQQLRQIGAELSERDEQILSDLDRLRLLSGRQLQRLHFHDLSPLTSARRCRAVLERLYEKGLVQRLDRRIGGHRAGSAGYVYALTARGHRLLDTLSDRARGRARRSWQPSSWFLDHQLAVAELYVQLREWERTGLSAADRELVSFDAEPACWRHWSGYRGQEVLKPDAHVVLGIGDVAVHAFAEVDLATESTSVLRTKADSYARYWQSGTEQHRHGVFPKVVFLVPDEQRHEVVVTTLGRLPPEHWQLFGVGLLEQAVETITSNSNQPSHPLKGGDQ